MIIAAVCLPAYAQISDVTPPVLETFTFTPTTVDTRSGPQVVTFTFEVSDDLAGASGMLLHLVGPDNVGPDNVGLGNQWRQTSPTRTSGTAFRGTYTATVSFPQWSASGVWRVDTLYIQDQANNIAAISTRTLRQRQFPATFEVISTPDTTPPRIETLDFTPAAVETSATDVTLNIRMRLTDTQSGIGIEGTPQGCECSFELMLLVSPSER